MKKVILTVKFHSVFLFLLNEKGQIMMIRQFPLQEEYMPGSIYIGQVTEIAAGIGGAFVAISKESKVFVSLKDKEKPIVLNDGAKESLRIGDQVLVQISTPPLKTKLASASFLLSRTGTYCICRPGEHGISYSKKLSQEKKALLKEWIAEGKLPSRKNYGFVIRTNAGELHDAGPLLAEMQEFICFFDAIKEKAPYRTLYSCLYQEDPEMIAVLKDLPISSYDEVLTDDERLYQLLSESNVKNVRFYQDDQLSIWALYSLESGLKQATEKKVWLPSGGYLVIEPTEAMLVIDVNTGKGSIQKGNREKCGIALKVNLEAAKEIARQLRIRNISGMIMVDFINMKSKEEELFLMEKLAGYLAEDTVKTRLIDMTPLGIVEITRKKVSKPLDIKS